MWPVILNNTIAFFGDAINSDIILYIVTRLLYSFNIGFFLVVV